MNRQLKDYWSNLNDPTKTDEGTHPSQLRETPDNLEEVQRRDGRLLEEAKERGACPSRIMIALFSSDMSSIVGLADALAKKRTRFTLTVLRFTLAALTHIALSKLVAKLHQTLLNFLLGKMLLFFDSFA